MISGCQLHQSASASAAAPLVASTGQCGPWACLLHSCCHVVHGYTAQCPSLAAKLPAGAMAPGTVRPAVGPAVACNTTPVAGQPVFLDTALSPYYMRGTNALKAAGLQALHGVEGRHVTNTVLVSHQT